MNRTKNQKKIKKMYHMKENRRIGMQIQLPFHLDESTTTSTTSTTSKCRVYFVHFVQGGCCKYQIHQEAHISSKSTISQVVFEFKKRCKSALLLNNDISLNENGTRDEVWLNTTPIVDDLKLDQIDEVYSTDDLNSVQYLPLNIIRIFSTRDDLSRVLLSDIGLASVLSRNSGAVKIQKFPLFLIEENERKRRRLEKLKKGKREKD
jgi:hypothetical protein